MPLVSAPAELSPRPAIHAVFFLERTYEALGSQSSRPHHQAAACETASSSFAVKVLDGELVMLRSCLTTS